MKAIGTELQEARHTRGMTLEEVSAATKVPVRILEDIEENHLDRLPGGVFARAHLRAYARQVGVDADALVDAYLAQRFGGFEEELPLERRPPVEPEPPHRTRTLLLEAAAVAMAVAVYGSCGPSSEGARSSAVTSPERGRPAAAAVVPDDGYVDAADDQAPPAPGDADEPAAVRTTGGNDDTRQRGAEPG